MMNRTISPAHAAECVVISAILLKPGTRIQSLDAVVVEHDEELGRDSVRGVHLHVSAEQDIADDGPNAECPPIRAAGDCWQEVWQAWPERDPTDGSRRIAAMRTI